MRVCQVNLYNYQNNNFVRKTCHLKKINQEPSTEQTENINFRGKFGAWTGGILGAAAVAATAALVAPVAVCWLAGGAFIGAVGGDAAEDAVNDEKKE